MKICAAQLQPVPGGIDVNIGKHRELIRQALSRNADMVFFPELSITGYEPSLAERMAFREDDPRLADFQALSDEGDITIGIGLPTRSVSGIRISMMIFQPAMPRKVYSKQLLHADELPWFVAGDEQLVIEAGGKRIAPAICYESLQTVHAENAFANGADLYMASVAKSAGGIEKASRHYPVIAQRYGIPVIMANSTGPSDDFLSVGQSAVWNKEGKLVAQLGESEEGILLYDTETGESLIYLVQPAG